MYSLLGPLAELGPPAEHQALVHGLPQPGHHVLLPPDEALEVQYAEPGPGDDTAFDRDRAVAAIADILPVARRAGVPYLDSHATIAADPRFSAESRRASVDQQWAVGLETPSPQEEFWRVYEGPRAYIGIATPELVDVLDQPAIADAIGDGAIVVLGIAERSTTIEVTGREYAAVEVPARVLHGSFPRVLVPPQRVADLGLDVAGTGDLFAAPAPITDEQRTALYEGVDFGMVWVGSDGRGNGAWVRWAAIGATLVVALVILALVTMLSATESDHDLRTMVAVGAAPRIRRRFLGLQSGVHALVGAVLAVPLALALAWAVSRAEADFVSDGVFGAVSARALWLPWPTVGLVLLAVPVVIGAVISLLVRSAPTVPPRRLG